jgi:hypothetical protein
MNYAVEIALSAMIYMPSLINIAVDEGVHIQTHTHTGTEREREIKVTS